MFWLPWSVTAFLALLTLAIAWVWLPERWHAALQSSRVGQVLPTSFIVLAVVVYWSLLV